MPALTFLIIDGTSQLLKFSGQGHARGEAPEPLALELQPALAEGQGYAQEPLARHVMLITRC